MVGSTREKREPERYEAMPDLASLPGWLWRRSPAWGRAAMVLSPLVLIGVILVLGPGIQDAKERDARTAEQERAQLRAERIAEIRRAQRPRFGAAPPAPADEAARVALLEDVEAAVRDDARRRVAAGSLGGPIRRSECEAFPRNEAGIGAERNLAERHGNYSCLAITAEFGQSGEGREAWGESESGAIGHPYRARVDFETGRFAYCKVSGRPAEGGLTAKLAVTVPRRCGGR